MDVYLAGADDHICMGGGVKRAHEQKSMSEKRKRQTQDLRGRS